MPERREWVTRQLSGVLSTWLLRVYRRPMFFLLGLMVAPLGARSIAVYVASTSLWRNQTLHTLGITAHLAATIMEETFAETVRLEQLISAQPAVVAALPGW